MKKIVLHNTSMIEKKEIEERSINLAHYIIDSKDTVRGAGVRIDIWTHFMRGCIINYAY